jgi:hypothetical protein
VAGAAVSVAVELDSYLGGSSALEQAELADQLAHARRLNESAADVEGLRQDAESACARVAEVLPEFARRKRELWPRAGR